MTPDPRPLLERLEAADQFLWRLTKASTSEASVSNINVHRSTLREAVTVLEGMARADAPRPGNEEGER
jgi:hypothetical protein